MSPRRTWLWPEWTWLLLRWRPVPRRRAPRQAAAQRPPVASRCLPRRAVIALVSVRSASLRHHLPQRQVHDEKDANRLWGFFLENLASCWVCQPREQGHRVDSEEAPNGRTGGGSVVWAWTTGGQATRWAGSVCSSTARSSIAGVWYSSGSDARGGRRAAARRSRAPAPMFGTRTRPRGRVPA
jgi:hypothetical protein